MDIDLNGNPDITGEKFRTLIYDLCCKYWELNKRCLPNAEGVTNAQLYSCLASMYDEYMNAVGACRVLENVKTGLDAANGTLREKAATEAKLIKALRKIVKRAQSALAVKRLCD